MSGEGGEISTTWCFNGPPVTDTAGGRGRGPSTATRQNFLALIYGDSLLDAKSWWSCACSDGCGPTSPPPAAAAPALGEVQRFRRPRSLRRSPFLRSILLRRSGKSIGSCFFRRSTPDRRSRLLWRSFSELLCIMVPVFEFAWVHPGMFVLPVYSSFLEAQTKTLPDGSPR